MKSILTAMALAVAAILFVPATAQASNCGACGARHQVQAVVIGYQRCGTPIYRYVTQPCRHHHQSYGHGSHYGHGYNSHYRSGYSRGNHYDSRRNHYGGRPSYGSSRGGCATPSRGGIYLRF